MDDDRGQVVALDQAASGLVRERSAAEWVARCRPAGEAGRAHSEGEVGQIEPGLAGQALAVALVKRACVPRYRRREGAGRGVAGNDVALLVRQQCALLRHQLLAAVRDCCGHQLASNLNDRK